jgi:hypothetical protein
MMVVSLRDQDTNRIVRGLGTINRLIGLPHPQLDSLIVQLAHFPS